MSVLLGKKVFELFFNTIEELGFSPSDAVFIITTSYIVPEGSRLTCNKKKQNWSKPSIVPSHLLTSNKGRSFAECGCRSGKPCPQKMFVAIPEDSANILKAESVNRHQLFKDLNLNKEQLDQ
jgi:hypothetical protein